MASQQSPQQNFFNSNLFTRICSALVLAPIVIAAEWWGGWPFLVVVLIVSLAVCFEWLRIISPQMRSVPLALVLALMLASLYFVATVSMATAFWPIFLLFCGMLTAGYASGQKFWLGAGFAYAFLLGAALLLIRNDPEFGMAAIALIVAVVWATDIFAYVVGRTFGGPKLWPAVSPGKTWSGAIGGLCAGVLASVAFIGLLDNVSLFRLIVMGLLLSIASQCGDLFESWIKRRFKVKDSSHLIPGHGGVMDRVDGLVFAVIFAVFLSWVFDSSLERPAQALFFGST
ncbi:MAG: phosphatidate cytidylyltransferase [Alphaproteobacteria bacterium]